MTRPEHDAAARAGVLGDLLERGDQGLADDLDASRFVPPSSLRLLPR